MEQFLTAAEFSNLGMNIKHYRNKKHISQETFGEMIGVSRQTVSNIERGVPGKQPKLGTLKKIAKLLDVEMDRLFSDI